MKIQVKLAAFFASLIICASFCAAQQTATAPPQQSAVVANSVQLVIEGKVISVHDGDTVTVLDQNNKKFPIRLQGIDAPELKQAFGSGSQENLARMVLGKQVTIFWNKVDKYRRTVGTIMLDGRDVNIEQVKAGLAWHFKKYEDEQAPADRITYSAAETSARNAKLGLWGDTNPMVPGDWRQEVKTKRWGPLPPEGTIIGNKNSKKYHRPDCSGYRDMSERNRVFFKSVEEAEAAGFKRAGNCPAEIQASAAKISSPVVAVGPATATASAIAAKSTTVPATVTTAPVAVTKSPAPVVSSVQADPVVQPNGNQAAVGDGVGQIIGNKNSKVYHLPGCASYSRVSEKNQVRFSSVEEAETAGYKRAGNCPADKKP